MTIKVGCWVRNTRQHSAKRQGRVVKIEFRNNQMQLQVAFDGRRGGDPALIWGLAANFERVDKEIKNVYL